MKRTVLNLLNEAQQKMGGYVVYMNYQFINFSVLAEPAALLSVEVEINGEHMNLEDVADVAIQEDTQFAIIPKDPSFIFPICKGIGVVHPEYKIEVKSLDESDDDSESASESQDSDEDNDKYILCTMPEMNKDRRDAGMDYVKTIYDEFKAKVDSTHATYGVKIGKHLVNAKPEESDEAKDELDQIHSKHLDLCQSYREEKEQQIEKAYQIYLKQQAEKESAEQEKQAAHSEDAGKQMSMDALSNE